MEKIQLPEPCGESWGKMKAKRDGRFCGSCCQVVVDFTDKTAEEIQAYFAQRAGEKICGRYRASQVEVPAMRRSAKYSNRLLRFALGLYLAFVGLFSTGCFMGKRTDTSLTGIYDADRASLRDSLNVQPADTIKPQQKSNGH